nr:hypothetical protein [Candidatus Gracilibacteria bacterium]
MNDLDKKIIELFKVIYDLGDEEINDLLVSIKDLTDDEKKSTIVALYERYKSIINNSNILLQDIDNLTDKISAESIIFNF